MNSTVLSEVATGGIGAAMTIYQLCPSAFFMIMASISRYATIRRLIHLLGRQDSAYGTSSVGTLLNSTVGQIDCELKMAMLSHAKRSLRVCAAMKAQIASARGEMTVRQHQQAVLQDPKSYLNEVALKLDTVVNVWQTVRLLLF